MFSIAYLRNSENWVGEEVFSNASIKDLIAKIPLSKI